MALESFNNAAQRDDYSFLRADVMLDAVLLQKCCLCICYSNIYETYL